MRITIYFAASLELYGKVGEGASAAAPLCNLRKICCCQNMVQGTDEGLSKEEFHMREREWNMRHNIPWCQLTGCWKCTFENMKMCMYMDRFFRLFW